MDSLVSVIMPVYNAHKYVYDSINSILDQTYNNIELILVIDCPTDNTLQVIEKIKDRRIKTIYNVQNEGISFSRNRGLALASGKYIALMDDDDISYLDRIEKQVNFLEKNQDIDAVGGKVKIIDGDGKIIEETIETLVNPKYIRANFLFRNVLMNGTTMLRKSILDENNITYRQNCYGMEDFDFWIRFSKVGKITNLNDFVLKYRKHNNESHRVLSEKKQEKMKKYGELQIESLVSEGYVLDIKEKKCICDLLNEFQENDVKFDDFVELCEVLNKIIHQALGMEKDYQLELRKLVNKIVKFQLGRVKI